jgi:hypothetical protein
MPYINELSDTVTALENCWKLRTDYIEQKSILNDGLANTHEDGALVTADQQTKPSSSGSSTGFAGL